MHAHGIASIARIGTRSPAADALRFGTFAAGHDGEHEK
jgi:hypothetical protein